jgi:hypothetical protein
MSETDPFRTPQERAQWVGIVNEHVETVRKLKAERQRVRRLLIAANARVAELADGPELAHLQAHIDLLESFLRHVQLQDPDSEVWNVPDNATLAAIEWESLVSSSALLRMGWLNFERLSALIATDMPAALAGEAPTMPLPSGWAQLRDTFKTRPEWPEALRRFSMDFESYRTQVGPALEAFEALKGLPASPDRLARGKAIGLPAAKGIHYRLESGFRRLPNGEAFLVGIRYETPDAPKGPDPDATGARKRSLTDQVLGFLKKG